MTDLSNAIQSQFHLTPSQIKACSVYLIRYWDCRFIYSQLLRGPRLIKDKLPYTPIFLDGLTQEYLGNHPDEVIRCSFRALKGKRYGYVLISTTSVSYEKTSDFN